MATALGRVIMFERDGYLVLPDFIEPADCDLLIARAAKWIADAEVGSSRSIFTTHEQTRTSDAYFLESGDKIRCFFEEEDTSSVNKIGHALHDLDPVFATFSRRNDVADVCATIGMQDPVLLQSMYILKNPRVGGEVTLHQDATFLYTEPITVIGLWFALEDATIDNGCLWVIPGGHHLGLKRRFRRAVGGGTEFVELEPGGLPREGEVPLEVTRGTLVVLHGLLPHRSDANRSSRSRHAYSLHVIERHARYPADNWLQRGPDMPLHGFGNGGGELP